ncbi:MAG: hypothetical protein K0S45_1575 [Nitrospira sp.]|jgi:hypothetical protein|nr:hypothetical protein [Nitrospira sp.]
MMIDRLASSPTTVDFAWFVDLKAIFGAELVPYQLSRWLACAGSWHLPTCPCSKPNCSSPFVFLESEQPWKKRKSYESRAV